MAHVKDEKIKAACVAAGVTDPKHHEAAVEASAAGFNLLALLQLLQTASPAILALIQAFLDARKKPPVVT